MKVALKKTTPQTAEVLRPPSARQAEILVKKTCQISHWQQGVNNDKQTAIGSSDFFMCFLFLEDRFFNTQINPVCSMNCFH